MSQYIHIKDISVSKKYYNRYVCFFLSGLNHFVWRIVWYIIIYVKKIIYHFYFP